MKVTNDNLTNEYIDAFSHWFQANIETLRKLYEDFSVESGSTLGWSPFCTQMFTETKPGRQAETLLKQ